MPRDLQHDLVAPHPENARQQRKHDKDTQRRAIAIPDERDDLIQGYMCEEIREDPNRDDDAEPKVDAFLNLFAAIVRFH